MRPGPPAPGAPPGNPNAGVNDINNLPAGTTEYYKVPTMEPGLVEYFANEADAQAYASAIGQRMAAAQAPPPQTYGEQLNAAGVSGTSASTSNPDRIASGFNVPSPKPSGLTAAPAPVRTPNPDRMASGADVPIPPGPSDFHQGDIRGPTGGLLPASQVPGAIATGNAIAGGAMVGFNDIAQGFKDVFDVGFNVGKNTRNVATGKPLESLGQTTGEESSTQIGRVSAEQFKDVAAPTAAYILPGGAILHGVGDVNESPEARVFDVGVGLLPFVPGLGAGGGVASAAERAGIGAGAGGAIGFAGSALHGGSVGQDVESGLLGAGLGAAGGVLIPKAVGGLQDMFKGSPPSVSPDVTTIGTTETGEPTIGSVHDFPGSEVHGGPAELETQVGPGDVMSTEHFGEPIETEGGVVNNVSNSRVTLTKSGFDLSDVGEGSVPVKPAGFTESGMVKGYDPLKGETFNEGPPPTPSTSALAGREPPAPSEPWDMPGYKGGNLPGETRSPFKVNPDDYGWAKGTTNPSEDVSLSGPTGPDAEHGFPAGGGTVASLDVKTDYLGNAQGTPWEEARFRSIYAGKNVGEDVVGTGYTFIPVPPTSLFSAKQKQVPVQGQSQSSIVTPVGTASNRGPTYHFEWTPPPTKTTRGTTPATKVTPDTTPFTVPTTLITPVTTPLITPIIIPKQKQPLTAEPFLGFSSGFVDIPAPNRENQPRGGGFPGLSLAGFGFPVKKKSASKFAYGEKHHPLGQLFDFGAVKKRKKR